MGHQNSKVKYLTEVAPLHHTNQSTASATSTMVIKAQNDILREPVTKDFKIITRAKQGCCIAPFFVGTVHNIGRSFRSFFSFKIDGSLFNLARYKADTKVQRCAVRELMFADDLGLFALSERRLQEILNKYHKAIQNFGFIISNVKTNVLFQPCYGQNITSDLYR